MTLLRMISLAGVLAAAGIAVAETGRLEIAVVDEAGQPLPCRIHLYNKAGKPQRADGLPFWRGHFDCPGNIELDRSELVLQRTGLGEVGDIVVVGG